MSSGAILDGYDVVVCEQCGFCFADNLPDQLAFDEYYREMSKYEHRDRGGQQTESDTRRYPVTARFIRNFVLDHKARILDIGCATGGLLYEFKKNGYGNLMGLDPSPVCAVIAKELYGVPVMTGALSEMSDGIGPFDLIILCAVLEHISHLRALMQQIRNLLSGEGVVYVEVPDVTKFPDSCDTAFQEFSVEHINFFSPISLVNLLKACGFEQVSLQQTVVEQSAGRITHDIKAVFKKGEVAPPSSLFRDMESRPALSAYIACSEEVERRILSIVNAWVDSGKPIIVWGAGTHTQRLLATSSLAKANILFFVDSNPTYQSKQLNGIPIIAPSDVKDKSEPILISSRDFQQEIIKVIRDELHCDNDLILLYEL